MDVVDRVEARGDVFEEMHGSVEQQDTFFGTTIAPRHLLGWPVQKRCGELYGALVVQRTSIQAFSKVEKKIVSGVAKRIGRYAV
jgi:hypothetical protein